MEQASPSQILRAAVDASRPAVEGDLPRDDPAVTPNIAKEVSDSRRQPHDDRMTNDKLPARNEKTTQPTPAMDLPNVGSLGERSLDVPVAVHEEMQRLADAGVLPTTTAGQRARNRPKGDDTYRLGCKAPGPSGDRLVYI